MSSVATEPNSALTDQIEPEGLFEVIDGRIVEKTMGVYENLLAAVFFGVLDRYAYTSVTSVSVLAPGAEIDGSDVLPGLPLSVKDLFEKAGQRG